MDLYELGNEVGRLKNIIEMIKFMHSAHVVEIGFGYIHEDTLYQVKVSREAKPRSTVSSSSSLES